LPNVGKSTLFNAVYPHAQKRKRRIILFARLTRTLACYRADARLYELQKIAKTNVVIPAAVEFVDIAGLVKGASQGEGLGNKFLSHIREVDAIVQVVRLLRGPGYSSRRRRD